MTTAKVIETSVNIPSTFFLSLRNLRGDQSQTSFGECFKLTHKQKLLLTLLKLNAIYSGPLKKVFNLVKSVHAYGGLKWQKAFFNGSCPSSEKSVSTYFCDLI